MNTGWQGLGSLACCGRSGLTHFGFGLWKKNSLHHVSLAPPISGFLQAPERARGVPSKGDYEEKGSAGEWSGKGWASLGSCADSPGTETRAPEEISRHCHRVSEPL